MHTSNIVDIIMYPINLMVGVILLPLLAIVGITQLLLEAKDKLNKRKTNNKEKQ